MKRARFRLSIEELHQSVAESDKKRFTISEDGKLIRAAQGHSVDVDLGLEAVTPQDVLFPGTARGRLDSIFNDGLNPVHRQQEYLPLDPETAERLGQRHGKPFVLRIDTDSMPERVTCSVVRITVFG